MFKKRKWAFHDTHSLAVTSQHVRHEWKKREKSLPSSGCLGRSVYLMFWRQSLWLMDGCGGREEKELWTRRWAVGLRQGFLGVWPMILHKSQGGIFASVTSGWLVIQMPSIQMFSFTERATGHALSRVKMPSYFYHPSCWISPRTLGGGGGAVAIQSNSGSGKLWKWETPRHSQKPWLPRTHGP